MSDDYTFQYQDPATMTNDEILVRHSIVTAILDTFDRCGGPKTNYIRGIEYEENELYNEMEKRYTEFTIAEFEKQFK